MRALLLGLVLLASAYAPTVAANPGAGAPVLEDAEGDAQAETLGGVGLPTPAPGAENVDLKGLTIAEDAESLTLVLSVKSLAATLPTFSSYDIDFTWKGNDFTVYVDRSYFPETAGTVGGERVNSYLLSRDDDDRRRNRFAELDVTMDAGAGTFTVGLPKAYILDDRGRLPLLGEALTDLAVEARSTVVLFSFTYASADRMPDDGEGKYTFLYGDISTGGLRLDADERVRVSNGGATTFVYQATLTNNATREQTIDLTLADMPEGWDGRVQSPVKVPAESERRVTVLVSVPFAHEHGGFSSFELIARSQRDASALASIRMGVVHTPIPQPAGHHSELYLHSETFDRGIFGAVFPWDRTSGFLNTDADHTNDAESIGLMNGRWWLPLAPGLRMGLDFDTGKTGTIAGSILGKSTSTAKVTAELILASYVDGDREELLLATSDAKDVQLDLSNPTPFQLTLTPTPESDYVPYKKGQDLVLVIEVDSDDMSGNICCIGTESELLVADFKMTLPLNEYHDRLSGVADVADSIGIIAEGAVEKLAMPGTVMTYGFTLKNDGPERDTINVDVAGGDAGIGKLTPEGDITLAPGASRRLTLAVEIPMNATDGQEMEVLVFAYSQRDPSKTAVVRTLTTVVKAGSTEAAPDESAVFAAAKQETEKDTPMGGALLVLAAVGLALAVGRRRS